MTARAKRLAERKARNQQLAALDAANRCAYCRRGLQHRILVVETGEQFCSEDCQQAMKERAEAGQ